MSRTDADQPEGSADRAGAGREARADTGLTDRPNPANRPNPAGHPGAPPEPLPGLPPDAADLGEALLQRDAAIAAGAIARRALEADLASARARIAELDAERAARIRAHDAIAAILHARIADLGGTPAAGPEPAGADGGRTGVADNESAADGPVSSAPRSDPPPAATEEDTGPLRPDQAQRADAVLIRGDTAFDADWYVDRHALADGPWATDPALHYVMRGATAGLDPGPGFDTRFYLRVYPEVARAGLNPLAHYIRHGRAEGRPPHGLREDG